MNYILGTILESKITGVEKAQINKIEVVQTTRHIFKMCIC